MPSSHTEDSIDRFTLEILRAGYALTGLGAELAGAMRENPDGDGDGSDVYAMISGSIRAFLAEANAADVDRATELMSGAVSRVMEHMQLALELRGRMEGTDGLSRSYDDPQLEAFMTAAQQIELPAPSGPADELAVALVDVSLVLGQTMADMEQWLAHPNTPPSAAPVPVAARNLLAGLVDELGERFTDADLTVTAQILEALTRSLTEDVFYVDPDAMDPDAGG